MFESSNNKKKFKLTRPRFFNVYQIFTIYRLTQRIIENRGDYLKTGPKSKKLK